MAAAVATGERVGEQQYTGELLPNGVRHGKGTLVYGNAFFRYTGDWDQGVKQGFGELALGDGSFYQGAFQDGEISGRGVRSYASGAVYEGDFVLGEKCGEGVQTEPDGERYEGGWRDNRRHGSGEHTLPNGDKYLGDFVAHRRCGVGLLQCANGDMYDGEWKDNLQHGRGTAAWANGDTYEGEWAQGRRDGQGTFVDAVSGVQYSGTWVADVPSRVPQALTLWRKPQQQQPADAENGQQEGGEKEKEKEEEEEEEDVVLAVTLDMPWARVLSIQVLTEGAQRLSEESGRVLELVLCEAVLARLRTCEGEAALDEGALRVNEVMAQGSTATLQVRDATPGLREEERLKPKTCRVQIVADGQPCGPLRGGTSAPSKKKK